MAVAIVLGALAGAAGFLPLLRSIDLAKNATPTSNLGHAGALLLGVLVSFVILAVAAVACIVLARDLTVPFALAEAAALCLCAISFGASKLLGKK